MEDAGVVDGSAPPKVSRFLDGAPSPRDIGGESSPFDSMMEELASIAVRQSELVAQARVRQSEEVSRLQAQLASVQAELASSKAEQLSSKAKLERAEASAQRSAEGKILVMAELERERADADRQKRNSLWALKYLEQNRSKHFANIEEFRSRVELALKMQEEKLRRLSIEYDEELYPHMVQSVAERRYMLLYLFITCIYLDPLSY